MLSEYSVSARHVRPDAWRPRPSLEAGTDNRDDFLQLTDPQYIGRPEVHEPTDRCREDRLERQHELGWVDKEIERQVRGADEAEHGDAHEEAGAYLLQGRDSEADQAQAGSRGEQDEQQNRLDERRNR